jgi:hypothetical protein
MRRGKAFLCGRRARGRLRGFTTRAFKSGLGCA